MTLADKIIKLRRKEGLSQEELADKLGISRQAVSKWESAQSMPDIDKILLLSEFFGVTTDYLLKEESTEPDSHSAEHSTNIGKSSETKKDSEQKESSRATDDSDKNDGEKKKGGIHTFFEEALATPAYPTATLEDAKEYLDAKKREARVIAMAVMLFILSPIAIIVLPSLFDVSSYGIILGLVVLFSFITLGVGLCIYADMLSKNVFIKVNRNCNFDSYSISYAEEQNRLHSSSYTASLIIGISLCIISPIPLIIVSILGFPAVAPMIGVLLALVAIGIAIVTNASIISESEELFIRAKQEALKPRSKLESVVLDCYWTLVLFLYLTISFISERWDITWVIWPIAPVFSSLITTLFKAKRK